MVSIIIIMRTKYSDFSDRQKLYLRLVDRGLVTAVTLPLHSNILAITYLDLLISLLCRLDF